MKEKIFGNQRFFLTFTAVFFFLIIGAIIFANMIWAADPVNVEYQVKFADLQSGDFLPQYINKIYKWLIMAGLFLVGVMIVVGGAMYLSSAGDKGTITKGKQYIVNSLIGLLLLASSYVILFTINPDAVQLDDFEIKAVEGTKVIDCGCKSDSECPANQYCFNPNVLPYDIKEVNKEPPLKALAEIVSMASVSMLDFAALGLISGVKAMAKKGIKSYAEYTAKKAAAAAGKSAAKKAAKEAAKKKLSEAGAKALTEAAIKNAEQKVLTEFAKGPFKWSAKNFYRYAFSNEALFLSSIALMTNISRDVDKQTCTEKERSICVPAIFKYNLIPHGMGKSDVPGYELEDLSMEEAIAEDFSFNPTPNRSFLYNSDGTLPVREGLFKDQRMYFFEAPLGTIAEPLMESQGALYTGMVNTDACMHFVTKNHCPCIEWALWDSKNGNYICKRQARCVVLDTDTGGSKDADAVYLGGRDGVGLCLTGSKGEMCADDSDCRVGLKCVDLEKIGKGLIAYGEENWRAYAVQHSLVRQGIKGTFGYGSGGSINNADLDRDKVCMPVAETDVDKLNEYQKGFLYQPRANGCKSGLLDVFTNKVDMKTCYKSAYLDEEIAVCGVKSDYTEANFKAGKIEKISVAYYNRLMNLIDKHMATDSPGLNFSNNLSEDGRWSNRAYWYKVTQSFIDRYYLGIRFYNNQLYPGVLNECTYNAFKTYTEKEINDNKDDFSFYQQIGNDYYFIVYYDNPGEGGYDYFFNYCKSKNSGCGCTDLKLSMMLISSGFGQYVADVAGVNNQSFMYGLCETGSVFDYPYIILEVLPGYLNFNEGVSY